MAFPSDQSGRALDPVLDMFVRTRREASILKSMAQGVVNTYSTRNMSANVAIQIIDTLKAALELFAQARTTPGIGQFAQNLYSDATLDIVFEFNNMETECRNVRDWMVSAFPVDANGYLQKEQFSAANDGSRDTRAFTPTQLSGLFTRLNALAATID